MTPNCSRSCGFNALQTYMRLTGSTETVRLSGRVNNLLDIKQAAEAVGVKAEGRLLTKEELLTLNGYAILPVGNAEGTEVDPLHFVLVHVQDKNVTVYGANYPGRTTPDVLDTWKGHALVVGRSSH